MRGYPSAVSGVFCAAILLGTARADYTFSGSGLSGSLVSPSERWDFDRGWSNDSGLNYWYGSGTYGESTSTGVAYTDGMFLTFSGGGPIDLASVELGNAGGYCFTYAYGNDGTAFCAQSHHHGGIAYVTGPDSILFTTALSFDDTLYDAVVYFDGATPTSFSGEWFTEQQPIPSPYVPTPEPSSLLLLGTGALGAFGVLRRRFSA